MTEGSIIIHGHRGSRGTHPENTIPSFQEARDVGASFVELDVHLSKDGHVVVFHDFEISGKLCRDSSGNPVQGKIPLGELTLAQIKSFECGSAKLPNFPSQQSCPGAQIPTLEELIQWKLKQAPKMELNVEIKREPESKPYRPSAELLAEKVVSLLSQYGLMSSTLIQSFDFEVVRAVRKLDDKLEKKPQARGAIKPCRLLKLFWESSHELIQKKNSKARCRKRQNQCAIGVDPIEFGDCEVIWNDCDLAWNHHGRDDQSKEYFLSRKLHACQGVGRKDCRDDLKNGDRRSNDK